MDDIRIYKTHDNYKRYVKTAELVQEVNEIRIDVSKETENVETSTKSK